MRVKVETDRRVVIDFEEYLDALYRYAYALCCNRAVAEDLVQETCLRAIRAQTTLRPESHVKLWLFIIMRNLWLNELHLSRSKVEITSLDADTYQITEVTPDAFAKYIGNCEVEHVRTAIEQLPDVFREIITLREFEEISYEEIGIVLSCPLRAVISRLARARSMLRTLLLSSLQ